VRIMAAKAAARIRSCIWGGSSLGKLRFAS
jgi:hypothetical protein